MLSRIASLVLVVVVLHEPDEECRSARSNFLGGRIKHRAKDGADMLLGVASDDFQIATDIRWLIRPAHFGHRDHSDRSIVISEIGGS
jgi:hypothetical protein